VRPEVGRAAVDALRPAVADQSHGQVELPLAEHLALPRRGAADDELEGADVARNGEQLRHEGLELSRRPVPGGLPGRAR